MGRINETPNTTNEAVNQLNQIIGVIILNFPINKLFILP